jgi:HD-like signal output (HDOD) protein
MDKTITAIPIKAVEDRGVPQAGPASGAAAGRPFWDGQKALPTLPSVLFHFLGLLADPEVTSAQLASFIWTDPALLSRVIPLVNAAASGQSVAAPHLRQAIAQLGRERLRSLAYTTPLLRSFETQRVGFNPVTFWERSLWCAQACEGLARRLELALPEQYYVAGLLHDIGYLLFLQKRPFATKTVIERWLARPARLLEIEEAVMGIDHCRLGLEVAERLNLDPWIRRAIGCHHSPSPDSEWIERITCIGGAFCSYKGVDFFPSQTVARGNREREMEEIIRALLPSFPSRTPAELLGAMEAATERLADWVLDIFSDFSLVKTSRAVSMIPCPQANDALPA